MSVDPWYVRTWYGMRYSRPVILLEIYARWPWEWFRYSIPWYQLPTWLWFWPRDRAVLRREERAARHGHRSWETCKECPRDDS